MYVYKARVTDVYDADTITVDVDLGFHAWLRGEILGRDIVMRTYKDGTGKGKYGRWLAEIYRADGDAVSINQELVTNGLAVTASY